MNLDPGIYRGLTDEQYNTIPAMRWSVLKAALTHGLALKTAIEKAREDKPCFRFGRAFHAALYRPEVFRREMIVAAPQHMTPKGAMSRKKATVEWLDSLGDNALPVTQSECEQLRVMGEKVHAHPEAKRWLDMCTSDPDGGFEVVFVWDELISVAGTEIRIRCKAKADMISPRAGFIGDAKTHQDKGKAITLHSVEGAISNLYYDGQLGFYARGARAAFADAGLGLEDFGKRGFIFVESVFPHDVAAPMADDEMVQEGDWCAETALRVYATCLATDNWPGCAPGKATVSLRRWRVPKNEDYS